MKGWENARFTPDTLDFEEIEDEGNYIRYHILHKDENGITRIDDFVEAGEHGGEANKSYFDASGRLLCTENWSEAFYEHTTTRFEFHKDGEYYCSREDKEVRDLWGACQFEAALKASWEGR